MAGRARASAHALRTSTLVPGYSMGEWALHCACFGYRRWLPVLTSYFCLLTSLHGIRPTHNIRQFRRNLALPGAVVLPCERFHHVASGFGRSLHCDHAGELLT